MAKVKKPVLLLDFDGFRFPDPNLYIATILDKSGGRFRLSAYPVLADKNMDARRIISKLIKQGKIKGEIKKVQISQHRFFSSGIASDIEYILRDL